MKIGEWWINDRWTVTPCDGDIGDLHHECVVLIRAISDLVEDISCCIPSLELKDDYDGDYHMLVEDLNNIEVDDYFEYLMEKGVNRKLYNRALNMNQDHRVVGMRDYGWSAVRNDCVDTWCLTRVKMKEIGEGLMTIGDDVGNLLDDVEFCIEDFSIHKLFTATPRQLCEGRVFPLQSGQPVH
jgi:hypothetical protein